MRKTQLFTAALAACVSLSAFWASATVQGAQRLPESAIKAENERWAEAFARGDYEQIGQLYTPDGALLPPGGGRVSGSSAITEYFRKQYVGSRPGSVTFSSYEFYGDDHAVTEISDAQLRDSTGKVVYQGKQVLIFLKQGDTWKLHRDMWNEHLL